MKLYFSNEDFYYRAMAILGTDCKSTLSNVEALLLLFHDVPYKDLENLCLVMGKLYDISPRKAYRLIQAKDPIIYGSILEIVDELVNSGTMLGNSVTRKHINTSSWLSHSVFEARLCQRLAFLLGVNTNIAYNFGLLHDYGRKFGHGFDHVIKGFEALAEQGYLESRACLTHSFLNDGRFNNNEIPDEPLEYVNDKEHFETEYDDLSKLLRNVEYTDYDRILNIADLMASDHGILPPIDRIYDILSRRGELDKAPNRVYFLTSYYNTLLWFLERINVESGFEYLDYKNVTLEEIYRYLENISLVFFENTVGINSVWTK